MKGHWIIHRSLYLSATKSNYTADTALLSRVDEALDFSFGTLATENLRDKSRLVRAEINGGKNVVVHKRIHNQES